jgi:hypothetical protein
MIIVCLHELRKENIKLRIELIIADDTRFVKEYIYFINTLSANL